MLIKHFPYFFDQVGHIICRQIFLTDFLSPRLSDDLNIWKDRKGRRPFCTIKQVELEARWLEREQIITQRERNERIEQCGHRWGSIGKITCGQWNWREIHKNVRSQIWIRNRQVHKIKSKCRIQDSSCSCYDSINR